MNKQRKKHCFLFQGTSSKLFNTNSRREPLWLSSRLLILMRMYRLRFRARLSKLDGRVVTLMRITEMR